MKARKPEPVEQPLKQPRLLNPNFKYINAASTDILKRFREMGWVPPSELKAQS